MNDPAAQSNPFQPTDNPYDLLRQLDLQIALQRARRLSGQGNNRRTARLIGFFAIALIFLGAMGALLYLKSTRYSGITHPRAAPAPAASGRPAR